MPKTYKEVSFDVSKEEAATIKKIAQRAVKMAATDHIEIEQITIQMDLEACIAQGCPLRLDALLAADDANFGHDVFGINRYMDRKTGLLTNCFLPRFVDAEVQHLSDGLLAAAAAEARESLPS